MNQEEIKRALSLAPVGHFELPITKTRATRAEFGSALCNKSDLYLSSFGRRNARRTSADERIERAQLLRRNGVVRFRIGRRELVE